MTHGTGNRMAPAADITFQRFDGSRAVLLDLIQELCDRILPHRPAGYLHDRMPLVVDPDLFLAECAGRPIGFKLGYRTSATVYLSWLGGVDEEFRRMGIASRLTECQHAHLSAIGMLAVETRTRSSNSAMLVVNLRAGFEIVGLETDQYGRSLVLQRKTIEPVR